MEPIDYMGALRRSWRLLLALAVAGAVVGLLLPSGAPKADKKASGSTLWVASMIVGAAPISPATALGGGVTDAQVDFYAAGSEVRNNTLDAMGIPTDTYAAATALTARQATPTTKKNQKPGPVLLSAYAGTAQGAVYLVQEYSNQLSQFLVNLVQQHQKANATEQVTPDSIGYQVLSSGGVVPVGHAAKKASVTSSRKVRALIGAAIGLLLGAAIVLTRELLEKRIRNRARAESTFGFPVVAEIPGVPKSHGPPTYDLQVVDEPGSGSAEAYRMLRMAVLFEALAPRSPLGNSADLLMGNGYGLLGAPAENGSGHASARAESSGAESPEPIGRRQVVLVVSPGNEAARPQVAANFAAVYAEAGQRAVVISTAELGAGRNAVPTGTITGAVSREDVESRLEPSRIEGVFRLPLSDFVENSGQLVTRASAVIEATRGIADVVVVEAPPLLAVHHAEALSHAVDVVLVVGECWSTTFDDARRAGDLLRRMEAPVLGVVLANVPISRRDIRHQAAPVIREPGLVSDLSENGTPPTAEEREPAEAVTQTQA